MSDRTLGASLGARFAVTSAEACNKRKKQFPRRHTLTAATTQPLHAAVNTLAIKLRVTRSRAIEIAVEELCKKHGIEVEGLE